MFVHVWRLTVIWASYDDEQVKNLYIGKDHVGDAPLLKKIAAGLTTGELFLLSRCTILTLEWYSQYCSLSLFSLKFSLLQVSCHLL